MGLRTGVNGSRVMEKRWLLYNCAIDPDKPNEMNVDLELRVVTFSPVIS